MLVGIAIAAALVVGYLIADIKNFLKIEKLNKELELVDEKYRRLIKSLKNVEFTSKDK